MKSSQRLVMACLLGSLFIAYFFLPRVSAHAAEEPPPFTPPWTQEKVIPKEVKDKEKEKPVAWCTKFKKNDTVQETTVTYADGTTIQYTETAAGSIKNPDPIITSTEWTIIKPGPKGNTKITYNTKDKTKTTEEPGKAKVKEDWKEAKQTGLFPSDRSSARVNAIFPIFRPPERTFNPDSSGSPLLFAATAERPRQESQPTQERPVANIKIVTYGDPPSDTVVHFDPGPETTPESFLDTPPTAVRWDPKRDGEGPKTVPLTGRGIPVTEIPRGGINIGWGWAHASVPRETVFQCSGDDEPVIPKIPAEDIVPPIEGEVGREPRYSEGDEKGYLIITTADGAMIVIIDDDEHNIPGHQGKPKEVGRTKLLPGHKVEDEKLSVPEDHPPKDVFKPYPQPERPNDPFPQALIDEYKKKAHLERGATERYVIVTEEKDKDETTTVINIVDGNGELIKTIRKKGSFRKAIANQETGEKTILTQDGNTINWVSFDYVTGEVFAESSSSTAAILQKDDDPVDVESAGGNIVVIQKWRGGQWIRVRIFGPDGTLISVYEVPGEYKGAKTNKSKDNQGDVKAIVFQYRDQVFADFIKVKTGAKSLVTDASGVPQNGIPGDHMDLQYHRVNNAGRFIEAVYDKGHDQTTVRTSDEAGTNISTQILRGKFLEARFIGGKKVFVTDWRDSTEVTVLEPYSGRVAGTKNISGKYEPKLGHIRDPENGNAAIKVGDETHTIPLN